MKYFYVLIALMVLLSSLPARADNDRRIFVDREPMGIVSIEGKKYNVYFLKGDAAYRIMKNFEGKLNNQDNPSTITSCGKIIEMPVGFVHANVSYGAYCLLKNTDGEIKPALMCQDYMLGRFKVMPWDQSQAIQPMDIIKYTAENCYGG